MRGLAVILTTCSPLSVVSFGAEPALPYTARVSEDEVEVRCGPAWEYYPTAILRRGDTVDVYRHDPGGWLAIRPPQGSFSWIPARQVQREDNPRVGKVTLDGAVVWVGSSMVDVRQHKWQVRLRQEELVEILEEKPWAVGPGFATETYYRIAPPAGEFRWIHAEHAAAPQALAHRRATRTIELENYSATQAGTETASHASAESPGGTTWAGAAGGGDKDVAALSSQVDQLKLDLALLVSRPITQWDLESLRTRIETLAVATRGTPLARSVGLLAHRLGECELLWQRHQRLLENRNNDSDEDPRVQSHGVSAAPHIERTQWQEEIAKSLDAEKPVGTSIDRLAAESSSPQFDAEGWLMPVHSTRRAAPPFALLDDGGRVICYVQPSPGLNLRRYAKTHVGLFGQAQHVSELRTSLLTVTRVVRRDK